MKPHPITCPIRGDLLIRDQTAYGPVSRFVVVDALSHAILAGPFATLREATVTAASLVKIGAGIWQENVDFRGRSLGAPMRLPIRSLRL